MAITSFSGFWVQNEIGFIDERGIERAFAMQVVSRRETFFWADLISCQLSRA